MLRCLQSTVHFWGGYGGYGTRLFMSLVQSKPLRRPARLLPLNLSARSKSDASCETLHSYLSSKPLEKLPLAKLVDLYQSVRARSQLQRLGPVQLSALISIFGASSLPPHAPRISNAYVEGYSSYPYWSYLLLVADDKKKLGYSLNDGDHYWVMWAWIARFHSNVASKQLARNTATLTKASFHYRQIWQKTKFPDILVPYITALLSSRTPESLDTAVVDLCGMLRLHSNFHGRSLELLWDLFLSFSEELSESSKDKILLSLWKRSTMAHINSSNSHYMATHMFNPLTKRHERLALGISHLIPALAAPIFPFFRMAIPLSVRQWADCQLKDALSPSCSVQVRWTNFSFFALYQTARNSLGNNVPTFQHLSVEHFSDWHVVLTLAVLEAVVPGNIQPSQGSEVRAIQDACWRKWIHIQSDRPVFVSRAVISAFLRLAGRTEDLYILEQCHRYAVDHGFWIRDPKHTAADRTQVEALVGDYVEASIRCHGKLWGDILRFFETQTQEPGLDPSYPQVIIRQLISRDVQLAYEFYEFCVSQQLPLGAKVTSFLGVALAPTQMHHVFHMLELDLNPGQTEEVVFAVMDSLCLQQHQYLSPTSGRILGRTLCGLLQFRTPASKMKYSLRYSLPLLVVSGNATDAVRIVELVNERAPSFFSPRFLQRLLKTLLRHRQFSLATRLNSVAQSKPGPLQDIFRRKLTLGLFRGGASALANTISIRKPRNARSVAVDEMARSVGFRCTIPTRTLSSRVLSILGRKTNDIPSIKYALSILILSKRPVAAKRLFRRSLPHLDSSTKTWFGNLFLHRIMRRFGTRNMQVIKKLYRARKYLMEEFGFVGDRVTFNVFLKAMLRWKSLDATNIRMLFDDCVRIGYPVGSHWRRVNNVPFSTVPSQRSSLTFGMSDLKPNISFERHARPLYKMFIKAFYVRGDIAAAKTVVGILKNEEAEALARQQHRNRARFEGLCKARAEKRANTTTISKVKVE